MCTSSHKEINVKVAEAAHYINIGKSEKGLDIINQLLSEEPNNAYYLYLRSLSLYRLDVLDEALDYCIEALSGGFSIEKSNFLMGNIYLQLNKYGEAEKSYLDGIRDNPQSAKLIAAYGYLMLKAGHDDKSKLLIEEAMRIDPLNPVALHCSYCYHLAKGNRILQIKTIEEIYRTSSDSIGTYIKVGLSEYFNGNYKSARENFREAYLLNPLDEEVLDILETTSQMTNPLFVPHRIIRKLGGPVVIWVTSFITLLVLRQIGHEKIAAFIGFGYLALAFYTWVVTLGYKYYMRRKNN